MPAHPIALRGLAVLLVALTLSACTTTTAETTTTTTESTTTTTTSPTAPAAAVPTAEELVANPWSVGSVNYFLQFEPDGTYEVSELRGLAPFESGTWRLEGDRLTMTTVSSFGSPGCDVGMMGAFALSWADDRSRIDVTLIEDACRGRGSAQSEIGLVPVRP